MNIDFCLDFELPKDTKEEYEIGSIQELEGLYIYNFDKILINLGSYSFNKNIKEKISIKKITRIIIHETLHKSIYEITNNVTNDKEEEIVNKISRGE